MLPALHESSKRGEAGKFFAAIIFYMERMRLASEQDLLPISTSERFHSAMIDWRMYLKSSVRCSNIISTCRSTNNNMVHENTAWSSFFVGMQPTHTPQRRKQLLQT